MFAADEKLVAQLTSRRKLYDSKGREKLESKAEMRARGLQSPDRADALLPVGPERQLAESRGPFKLPSMPRPTVAPLLLEGTWTWSGTLTIKKPIILRGQAAETTIVNNRSQGVLVAVTPSTSGIIEIQSLSFKQGQTQPDWSVRDLAVYHTSGGRPVLIHDCTFTSESHRQVEWATNGGVISHCHFISANRSDISCIVFKNSGLDTTWQQPSSLGMSGDPDGTKNTYLEDCTFKDAYLQAFDLDDNSRTVARHCTFDNSAITSYGQDTSPSGVRQYEIYDNESIFTLGGNCTPNPYPLNLNYWFYVRGWLRRDHR